MDSWTPLSTAGHTQPKHLGPELPGTNIDTGPQVSSGACAIIGHNISIIIDLLDLREGGVLVPVV